MYSRVNKYVNDTAPWSLDEKNLNKRNIIIYCVLEFIRKSMILLQPIIPVKSKIFLDSLVIQNSERLIDNISNKFKIKSGLKIKKIDIQFKKCL